jgi:hypothetical protein
VRLRVGARPPACARDGLTARQARSTCDALHGPRHGPPWERGEIMGAHSIGSQEGAVVAAETQSLYERLGGAYTIAVVVDEFIDRIMVDPRLNANPRVDEAHHRVSAQGFNYHVTEQVCLGGGRPADLLGAHDARRAPRSAHLRRGVGCVHGRLPPDPREVRRARARAPRARRDRREHEGRHRDDVGGARREPVRPAPVPEVRRAREFGAAARASSRREEGNEEGHRRRI